MAARQLHVGRTRVDLDEFRVEGPGGVQALSPLEVEVLGLLAARLGEVVERGALERGVWGHRTDIRSAAVPVFMRRLRAKLEDPAAPDQGLETVRGQGWRLRARVEAPAREAAADPGLVGRERELEELAGLREARWLTLHGPAGVGKTALLQAHARRSERPPVWVALEGVGEAAGLVAAMAAALQLDGAVDASAVEVALQARPGAELLLDAAEGLDGPALELLRGWSARVPRLRVRATSRVRLDLEGQALVEVSPLTPDAALALLRHRWRGRWSPRDEVVVQRLVEATDRLPLAIELVAGRSGVLTPQEIVARLDRRLDLLARAPAHGRHGGLRAALEWSWEELDPAGRSVVVQAAVFDSPFDLRSAEAVIAPPEGTVAVALEQLERRSWLRRRQDLEGRFELLASLRDFARERGAPGPELASAYERHREHVLAEVEGVGGVRLHRTSELWPLRGWRPDLWALVQRWAAVDPNTAVQAYVPLAALCHHLGPRELSRAALERLLAEVPRLRPRELARVALSASSELPARQALDLLERAEVALEGGESGLRAELWVEQARKLGSLGQHDQAQRRAEGALATAREEGLEELAFRSELVLALEERRRGDPTRARALAESVGPVASQHPLWAASVVHLAEGANKRRWLERAAALADEDGHTALLVRCWGALAELLLDAGEIAEAERLVTRALPLARSVGEVATLEGLWVLRGRLAVEAGRLEELEGVVAECAALPSAWRFRSFQGAPLRLRAWGHAARQEWGRAAELFERLGVDPQVAAAEAQRDRARAAAMVALQGDRARARELAAGLEAELVGQEVPAAIRGWLELAAGMGSATPIEPSWEGRLLQRWRGA